MDNPNIVLKTIKLTRVSPVTSKHLKTTTYKNKEGSTNHN